MLREETLFGVNDKVQLAIDRLRAYCPPEGFYVAFSGGKDSQAVLELAKQAGVKYDAHMALTTVDPPELLRFVRTHYPDVELMKPEYSMYSLIIKKRLPPTRVVRYCCDYLKERGGDERFVVTGVRWKESARRASRKMVETCFKSGKKRYLHPIIDWSSEDVWEYINERGLPHCSLYDEGWTRIGCVMCPCTSEDKVRKDAERWPHFAQMYRNACRAAFNKAVADGLRDNSEKWKSGDDMYEWWLDQKGKGVDPGPLESLFEEGGG